MSHINPSEPLSGLDVLVTRPAHQSAHLCELIDGKGGHARAWPTIEILPAEESEETASILSRLSDFQVAIFVSANAVEHGLKLLREHGLSLDHLKVAAVGNATAARLREADLDPVVPLLDANSEGLLALPMFWTPAINGKQVLIFRGDGGRELLGDTLLARGAQVEYAEVYRRARPAVDASAVDALWGQRPIDIAIVTSSSGLNHLVEMVGERHRDRLLQTQLLVMSDRLADYAAELGFAEPALVPEETSDSGIVDTLERWYAKHAERILASKTPPTELSADVDAATAIGVPEAPEAPAPLEIRPALAEDQAAAKSEPAALEIEAEPEGAIGVPTIESETPPAPATVEPASGEAPTFAPPTESVTEPVPEAAAFEETATPSPMEQPAPATPPPIPAFTPERPVYQASSMATAPVAPTGLMAWLPWAGVALPILLLLFGIYWVQSEYYPASQAARSGNDKLAEEIKALQGRLDEIAPVRGELASQADSQSRQVKELTAALEALRGEQKTQTEALTALAVRMPQGSEDWVLAEVDYLLLAADERLRHDQDVKSALAAMQAADDRLRTLARPNLRPVREQLIKDINAVREVKDVDVTGMSLYLADLLERVDQLPFKGGDIVDTPRPAAPEKPAEVKVSNWRDLTYAMWKDLTTLVSISDQQFKDPSLFDPEFRYLLQQHLRLEIAGARLDVMRRNSEDLKASLGIVKSLLMRYYDGNTESIKNVLVKLDEMLNVQLEPNMPDITPSLLLVREYVNQQHRRILEPKDKAAAEPSAPPAQSNSDATAAEPSQPATEAPKP